MIVQARSLVESVYSEMEAYHDGRSEEWQDSDRGEAFLDLMESIEEVASLLRDAKFDPGSMRTWDSRDCRLNRNVTIQIEPVLTTRVE